MATNNQSVERGHKWSALLTKQENSIISSLLGDDCRTLSTTLVQILVSMRPNDQHWHIQGIGIACLVTDGNHNYIRVYDFVEKQQLFEHKLTEGMVYNRPLDLFHTFETPDRLIGLNFADKLEAIHFGDTVRTRLSPEVKLKSSQSTESINSIGGSLKRLADKVYGFVDRRATLESIKQKLTKADIENPRDFRHVLNVGWNERTGFDSNPEFDHNLCQYFESIGISRQQMEPKENREFMREYIDKRISGIEDDNSSDISGDTVPPDEDQSETDEPEVVFMSTKPTPKPRTKGTGGPSLSSVPERTYISVSTQTDPYKTIESIIANKHFLSVSNLPPPSPVMANSMFY